MMRRSLLLPRLHAVRVPGVSGSYISTPDHADLDIIGDIDTRWLVAYDQWAGGGVGGGMGKFVQTGAQRSYRMGRAGVATINSTWSTNGGSGGQVDKNTLAAAPVAQRRLVNMRITLDVDNGAIGNDLSYFFKKYRPGSALRDLGQDFDWSLFETVTTAGATSIFSGSAAFEVGSSENGTASLKAMRVIAVLLKNGINGTTVAEFDASRMRIGDTTYTDRFGKVWTLNGNAHIAAA